METNTLSTQKGLEIDTLLLRKGALRIRAINHKLRQQMLHIIFKNGKITVTELYTKMRLEQSVASQHLAILRTGGFVDTYRDGKYIYYSVNVTSVQEVQEKIKTLVKS